MPATTKDLLKAATRAAANQNKAQQHARDTAARIAAARGNGAPVPAASAGSS